MKREGPGSFFFFTDLLIFPDLPISYQFAFSSQNVQRLLSALGYISASLHVAYVHFVFLLTDKVLL